MTFNLAPHAFALRLAEGIYDRVMARDNLFTRPCFITQAVLGRLRTGVRALEAFLRRILILIALEMEPELIYVRHPENLAWAKAKIPRVKKYALLIYPPPAPGGLPDFFDTNTRAPAPEWDRDDAIWGQPKVPIGNWLDRLDYLRDLAKDPVKKARRLAYKLARYRHGILMPPSQHHRLLPRWGTEASAIHDALAYQIIEKSKVRPPPHPPPRRGLKPSITVFW